MRVLVTNNPHAPHAQAGEVLELPDVEALDMITRGLAVVAPDEPPAELPGAPEPKPEPTSLKTSAPKKKKATPKKQPTARKPKKKPRG